MSYDNNLASRVRAYLSEKEGFNVEEKAMFGGLAFLVNDKMCINVGEDQLMCRFDPERTEELAEKPGFIPMVMNGKHLKGYCYVDPVGYKSNKDFEYWINLCLDYNDRAVPAKKRSKK